MIVHGSSVEALIREVEIVWVVPREEAIKLPYVREARNFELAQARPGC